MKVSPLQAVDGIPFGAAQAEVVAVFGEPLLRRQSRRGEEELRYAESVFRFGDLGLVEVAVDSQSIALGDVEIPFADLPAFLRANDQEVFDRVGFVVSPRFGVALEPSFESWVTLMPTHRIAAWKTL
nr:hypothetical protein [uncultured Albidiferax sp.]